MGDVALPKETVRRWKENITPEETQLIVSCRAKMITNFVGGTLVAGVATWAATSRLKSRFLRTSLALGVGYFGGLWGRQRSLESCTEKILSLDGSRIQTEYANMILSARRMNEQSKNMQIIARYFYSERVFDDSNSDLPKLRWRRRNFFNDTFVDGQIRQNSHSDDDSYGSNSGSNEETQKVSHKKLGHEMTGLHSKESSASPSTNLVEDPLDYVFGSTATKDANVNANANANSSTSSTSPKKLSRKSKRSQRRQRRRLHEADA